MQIGFGQISPSASSTRDLGTRLLPLHYDRVVPRSLSTLCVTQKESREQKKGRVTSGGGGGGGRSVLSRVSSDFRASGISLHDLRFKATITAS